LWFRKKGELGRSLSESAAGGTGEGRRGAVIGMADTNSSITSAQGKRKEKKSQGEKKVFLQKTGKNSVCRLRVEGVRSRLALFGQDWKVPKRKLDGGFG